MTITLKQEHALTVHGVEARAFTVIAAADGRIINQRIGSSRYYKQNGHEYHITVVMRFDDECNNGHETFAITADIREDRREYMGGCCHEEIAKQFPEWAHLIPWHLTSTDGPMHYIANTVYHAGDRDCWGLRLGEEKQIINGRTNEPCWELRVVRDDVTSEPLYKLEKYADGMKPEHTPRLEWRPLTRTGEGKKRELAHARSTAVWPEATDEELCQSPAALRAMLEARHPALMKHFKAAMLGAGFLWPKPRTVAK